jgi:hypothetical protein
MSEANASLIFYGGVADAERTTVCRRPPNSVAYNRNLRARQ